MHSCMRMEVIVCGFHEKIASLQHLNYTQTGFTSLIVALLFLGRVELTLTNIDLERIQRHENSTKFAPKRFSE